MPEVRGSFRSFDAAERFFRQKINLPTQRWDDLWQGQHARAFMAAGVARDAVLAELRAAVDAAIAKGETLADFRARFRDIVARHGWIGGAGNESDARRAWRARVIYQTNLRTAYMAGRWDTLKSFPYLKYQHHTLLNPREQHVVWDGLILANDNPWWQTNYPPNGWGCNCTVTGVSEARLRADGRRPDKAPAEVPGDPPPEWAYHVGVADQGREIADPALARQLGEQWTQMPGRSHGDFGRPDQVPVDTPVAQPLPEAIRQPAELRDAWDRLYGQSTTLRDPAGAEVIVSRQVIEHWLGQPKRLDGRETYLPLLRETIESPFEIWASFAQNGLGRVGVRRFYVKSMRLAGGRSVTLIAEVQPGGIWGTFNFFVGSRPQPRSRQGLLVYGRPHQSDGGG
jgi:hypothetical protein